MCLTTSSRLIRVCRRPVLSRGRLCAGPVPPGAALPPAGAPQLPGAGPPPAPPAKPASMTGSTGGEGPGLVSTGSVGPDEAPSALQALQEKYSAWQQRLDAAVAQARPAMPTHCPSCQGAGESILSDRRECHMLSMLPRHPRLQRAVCPGDWYGMSHAVLR